MVVEDDRHGVLDRRRLLEDDLADPGVLDDRLPLLRREGRRLLEDLLGQGQLADVVEQGREPQPVELRVGQPEAAPEQDGERGDPGRRLAPVVGVGGERLDERPLGGRPGEPPDLDRAGAALGRDRRARDPGVLVGLLEEVDLVAAEGLRRVHRGVGVADQGVDAEGAADADRDADRDGDADGTVPLDRRTRARRRAGGASRRGRRRRRASVSGRMTMNSSPPYRPRVSADAEVGPQGARPRRAGRRRRRRGRTCRSRS